MVSPLLRCFSAPATLNHSVPVAAQTDSPSSVHSEPLATAQPFYAKSIGSEEFGNSLPPPIKTRRQKSLSIPIGPTKKFFSALAKSWEVVTSESAHASTGNSPSFTASSNSSLRSDTSPCVLQGEFYFQDKKSDNLAAYADYDRHGIFGSYQGR
ncbi:MAG: hypothetical protein V4695_06530 [Pseudomonadota bacterium]